MEWEAGAPVVQVVSAEAQEASKDWVQGWEQDYCVLLHRMLPKREAEKRRPTTLVLESSVSPPTV